MGILNFPKRLNIPQNTGFISFLSRFQTVNDDKYASERAIPSSTEKRNKQAQKTELQIADLLNLKLRVFFSFIKCDICVFLLETDSERLQM